MSLLASFIHLSLLAVPLQAIAILYCHVTNTAHEKTALVKNSDLQIQNCKTLGIDLCLNFPNYFSCSSFYLFVDSLMLFLPLFFFVVICR